MKIGTKSILFGVHQFALHPMLVALAWWKIYGFPWDPRLWVAFIVHDLGYWGKPNMDGPEGETHVEFGAELICKMFDSMHVRAKWYTKAIACVFNGIWGLGPPDKCYGWCHFCCYHSRFYAKRDSRAFSRLCVADKLVPALMPTWLYLLLGNASGEIHEYMKLASQDRQCPGAGKYVHMNIYSPHQAEWHRNVCDYLSQWVEAHKDGREDTWTNPGGRVAITESGVWK